LLADEDAQAEVTHYRIEIPPEGAELVWHWLRKLKRGTVTLTEAVFPKWSISRHFLTRAFRSKVARDLVDFVDSCL
jgi:hypothetical protein